MGTNARGGATITGATGRLTSSEPLPCSGELALCICSLKVPQLERQKRSRIGKNVPQCRIREHSDGTLNDRISLGLAISSPNQSRNNPTK
jgi:hypothetical protein